MLVEYGCVQIQSYLHVPHSVIHPSHVVRNVMEAMEDFHKAEECRRDNLEQNQAMDSPKVGVGVIVRDYKGMREMCWQICVFINLI